MYPLGAGDIEPEYWNAPDVGQEGVYTEVANEEKRERAAVADARAHLRVDTRDGETRSKASV